LGTSNDAKVQFEQDFERRELTLQFEKDKEALLRKYKDKESEALKSREELNGSFQWLKGAQTDELANLNLTHEAERLNLTRNIDEMRRRREELEMKVSEAGQLLSASSNDSEIQFAKQKVNDLSLEGRRLDQDIDFGKNSIRIMNDRQANEAWQLSQKHRIETDSMNKYLREEDKRLEHVLTDLPGQRQQELQFMEKKYKADIDLFDRESSPRNDSRSQE
jgi:hypothetical protein